jgi:hypothetical protein
VSRLREVAIGGQNMIGEIRWIKETVARVRPCAASILRGSWPVAMRDGGLRSESGGGFDTDRCVRIPFFSAQSLRAAVISLMLLHELSDWLVREPTRTSDSIGQLKNNQE